MNVQGIILFLVLGFTATSYASNREEKGYTVSNNTSNRHKKQLLGIFTIVNFPNDACASSTTGRNGTCYTSSECTSKGGSSSGSCASSFGVCCVFELSCGSTVSENCTYFTSTSVSSSSSSTNCALSVCKCDSSVCQLRLDFDSFITADPMTTTTATTTVPVATAATAANRVGQCQTDQFTVTSPGNTNPPTICGTSSGDHMYVDASDICTSLNYLRSSTSSTTASYTIKITQIECTSKTKSPEGCTQYHTESSGTVNSYNYNSASGTHLADQDYSICIRPDRGACAICYTAPDASYELSSTSTFPIDTTCGTNAAAGQGDFIEIPGGTCSPEVPIADSTFSADRYCGTTLLCPGKINANANAFEAYGGATKNTICSMIKPFKINVHTDSYEDATITAAGGEARNPGNFGFELTYWQTTQCSKLP